MKKIKKMGFTDNIIGKYIGCEEKDVLKKEKNLVFWQYIKRWIPVQESLNQPPHITIPLMISIVKLKISKQKSFSNWFRSYKNRTGNRI